MLERWHRPWAWVALAALVSCRAGASVGSHASDDDGGATGGSRGLDPDGFDPGDGDPVGDKPHGCPIDPGHCTPGTQEPCYEGPPGTEGVGVCAPGIRTCNDYGTAYGSCKYQVLPPPDDCAQPSEWTCDARPSGCAKLQSIETGPVWVGGIAADGDDAWIRVRAPKELVVERLTDAGMSWETVFPATGKFDPDSVEAVAVDSQGHSIVAVSVDESLDLGTTVVSGPAAVVLELDANGDLVWHRAFTNPEPEESVRVWSVAAGPADEIWVAGGFRGEMDFGSGPATPKGDSDGFLMRLDSAGTPLWIRTLQSPTGAQLMSVAVTDEGMAIVGGTDGYKQEKCNHHAALLAAFDVDGEMLWKESWFSVHTVSFLTSLALDGMGAVFASGRLSLDTTNHALDLGGEPLDGSSFLAKFDIADGHHIWSTSTDDVRHGPAMGGHVAVNALGGVVWANQDEFSVRLRSYHPDGHRLWERLIPVNPSVQNGWIPNWGLFAFAQRPNGTMAIAGVFGGEMDFGAGWVSPGTPYFAVYDP